MPLKEPLKLIQNKGAVDILVSLFDEERLNVTQLSDKAGVCSGTLQRRLRELKANELVVEKIRESENSRLEKAYSLTEMGENLSKLLISVKEMGE